ncbi:hypothetical protein ACWFMI_14820 [Nocardiopsis terrae]
MTVWATPEEYALRAGVGLTDSSRPQITALLEDAEAVIRAHLPPAYEPPAPVARAILIKVARRSKINPGGRTSKTVGSTAESYDDRGGLFVTEDEVRALTAGLTRPSTAYTVGVADPGMRQIGGNPWTGPR